MTTLTPFLYIFAASFAFAIVFNIPPPKLVLSAIGGMLGQMVYALFQPLTSDGVILSLLAAIAISLYTEILARLTKSPATIYLAVALIPLVPGGGIYYTMLYFINDNIELGLTTGIHTFLISGALALGIIITSSSLNLMVKIILKSKTEIKRRFKDGKES